MEPNEPIDDGIESLDPEDFGGESGPYGFGALTVKIDGIAQGIDTLAQVSQANKNRLDKHSESIQGWEAVELRLQLLQGLSVSVAKALTAVEVRDDAMQADVKRLDSSIRRLEWIIAAAVLILAILEVLT